MIHEIIHVFLCTRVKLDVDNLMVMVIFHLWSVMTGNIDIVTRI